MQRVEAVLRLLQADATFLGSREFPFQHAHLPDQRRWVGRRLVAGRFVSGHGKPPVQASV